jgi:hypothetical protein
VRRALVLVALAGCQAPPGTLEAIDAGPPPDAPAPDARYGCDPLLQDCGDGRACVWQGPARFECVASLGLPRYHSCLTSAHCSPGDGCHLDDFIDFYCIAYCDHARYPGLRDPRRCDVSEICGEWDGPVGRCLAICDPLSANCLAGLACYLVPDAADLCVPILEPGAPGTACGRNNDCAPGSGCLGDPAVCTIYCDHQNYPDQPEPRCADGELCRALAGEDRIGACGPP